MNVLSQNDTRMVSGAGPCDACAYALGIGGGALSGGVAGARIGAVFGSPFGPVGMGVGIVLGGLAGAAIAYQAVN